MPTTYLIAASSLPALQGPGAARLIGDANTDPAATFDSSVIAAGDTSGLARKFSKNALALEYALRVGSPGYGVIEGLGFSDSGLTLTVAAGKATIDGLCELSVATTVSLANGDNYIHLKRDGTLENKSTTALPATPSCYIGKVVCAAGVVTSYDLSGVMYHWAGLLKRRTGDGWKPSDTPGVSWAFLQVSSNATYLWDGTQYIKLSKTQLQTLRTGAFAETCRRTEVAGDSGAILTSGQLYLLAVSVEETITVTSLGFLSGTTALGTPTHWWFALYNSALALLAQTSDQTSTAWAANTEKVVALSAPQVIQPGLYYVGVCCVGAVMPSLMAASLNAVVTALAPVLCGTSTGSLTGTAPNPAAAPTATAKLPWATLQ